MLTRWKKLTTKIVYKNPWWTYKLDTFEIPNKTKGEYHYVYTNGASIIVPVLKSGKIIFVNQYRYLCERESLELPCGGVKQGMTYRETAEAELAEETGYKAKILEEIAEFNPYNGVTNEICKIFIAKELQTSVVKSDSTEEFEILEFFPSEIEQLIAENKIWDGMTLAAWMLIRKLFL